MFDLKNFKPGDKPLVVPLAKLNQSASQPDDLELAAFNSYEDAVRQLARDTAQQQQSFLSGSDATPAKNPVSPSTSVKSATDD